MGIYKPPEEGRGVNSVVQDAISVILATVIACLIILILLPTKPAEKNDQSERSRGNIRVEVFWPDDRNVDIDTWGKAPGLSPVGYSNMQGVVLNLVRDDLGIYADISGRNYEIMFSRGIPDGEWIFNLHYFSDKDQKGPVEVTVLITMMKDDGTERKGSPSQIVSTKMTLTGPGQEDTIIRFRTLGGELQADSLNSVTKSIRSMRYEGDGF